MTDAIFLGLGLVVGALGVWWVQRNELVYLRKELATAQDRLLHAWKDGAIVPPRAEESGGAHWESLPEPLQATIDDWEGYDGADSREILEKRFRDQLAEGKGVAAILDDLRLNP